MPAGMLGLANRTVTHGQSPPARPCPSKVEGAWRHNRAPFKTHWVSQDQLCSYSILLLLLLTQLRPKCLLLMRCWAPPPQPEAPQILLMRCWAPLPAQPEAPQMPSPYDVLGVHPRLSPRLPKCLLLMRRWVSTAPRRPRLPTSQARPDSGSVGMGHTAPPAPGDLVGRGQRPRCPRLTPHAASSRPWTGPKGGAPVAGTSRNHAGGSAHDRKMTRVPATRGLLLTKQYTTVLSAGASCGIY